MLPVERKLKRKRYSALTRVCGQNLLANMTIETIKRRLENEGFETLIVGKEVAAGKILWEQGSIKSTNFPVGISIIKNRYSVRYVSSNMSPPQTFNSVKKLVSFLKEELA